MDENAKRLAQHGAETRAKMARGEYSAFPAATPRPAPATRQAPVGTMSDIERRSRENAAALFARWDANKALAAEFGEPDGNIAIDLAQRAVEPAEARRLFAQRAADRRWVAGLATAQQMH